jgi:hypothetical protein
VPRLRPRTTSQRLKEQPETLPTVERTFFFRSLASIRLSKMSTEGNTLCWGRVGSFAFKTLHAMAGPALSCPRTRSRFTCQSTVTPPVHSTRLKKHRPRWGVYQAYGPKGGFIAKAAAAASWRAWTSLWSRLATLLHNGACSADPRMRGRDSTGPCPATSATNSSRLRLDTKTICAGRKLTFDNA